MPQKVLHTSKGFGEETQAPVEDCVIKQSGERKAKITMEMPF